MTEKELPRILIIDDNEAIHADFMKSLVTHDSEFDDFDEFESNFFGEERKIQSLPCYDIDSAYQGKQGYEMVCKSVEENRPYSLAFVDIRMPPGWDGIETIQKLWEVCPELQIVICSAHSDYSWEETLDLLDTPDKLLILKKPFERIEVQQVAHAMTEKWRLTQEVKHHVEHLESRVVERTQSLEDANRKLQLEFDARIKAQAEKKTVEAQLIQAQKLEAIGQLSAGIAHEINTPMQYIGDNTRFVKDVFDMVEKFLRLSAQVLDTNRSSAKGETPRGGDKEEVLYRKLPRMISQSRNAIEESLEGVDRVVEIVKAMKVFSHIGPQEKVPTDLEKAIQSTVTIAKSEWKYVSEVEMDLDPHLPKVPVFKGEFNQAILNLVVNAAHAIADNRKKPNEPLGRITITARRSGDNVEIRVADTGSGIPVEARKRIFEPFFTTKEVGKGTGQGLAMAYASIVNKHGGAIDFNTELGKGTTFTINLPLESEKKRE